MNEALPSDFEQYGVGQPVRRTEDLRFLRGTGSYLEDLHFEGTVHAAFARSTHAHADIKSIDLEAARLTPGVLAVYTVRDCIATGMGPLPTRTPAANSSGKPVPKPEWPLMAKDRVRYVGELVAMVVAQTREAAKEAVDQIFVDYEPLPAVLDGTDALKPGAPVVWDEHPDNICVEYENGDPEAVAKAFANAAHTVKLDLNNNRVTAVPMENRAAIGIWNEGGRHQVYATTQNIHANQKNLAVDIMRIDPATLQLIAPDVGGGFGVKNSLYPEYALVLFASRQVGKPVRWVNDRTESFLSDSHGRDQRNTVELALDQKGKFLALRVSGVGNLGPYLMATGPFTPTGGSARTQGGPYRFPLTTFRGIAPFTNSAPTDPYRGAGRPEAAYQLDRVIDYAAHQIGMDPLELRRINALTPADLPFTMGSGAVIDSGDCLEVLDRTVKLADWDGFAGRRAEAARRGKRLGIGIGFYLECSGGGPKEHASITVEKDGTITLAVGSQSTGMGHETTLVQLLAHRLGISMDRVRYVQGDSDATPIGGGHGGSRGMEMGGSVVAQSSDLFIEKASQYAAHMLEAAAADIEFSKGEFKIKGTDRTTTMWSVIENSANPSNRPKDMPEGLDVASDYERASITFPYGCQICEAEVDPHTGVVVLTRFSIVDDFGVVINPLTAEGQVAGGVGQGIGQALMEEAIYDEAGQLITGSLMDYCLPRADDTCNYDVEFFMDAPTKHNPLGVKGSGEAGCCGALPAVVNAVVDALKEDGVRHIDMPLTPQTVWQAIQDAS